MKRTLASKIGKGRVDNLTDDAIQYRKFYVIAAATWISLVFGAWIYVPNMSWTIEIAIASSVVIFISAIGRTSRSRLNGFELFILSAASIMPIWSAAASFLSFGQPLEFGLLSMRSYVVCLSGIAVYRAILSSSPMFDIIKNAFIALAWINLALCLLIVMTVDPNQASHWGALVIQGGGVTNKFNLFYLFIVFGAVYYFVSVLNTFTARHAIYAIVFTCYLLIIQAGRISSLSLLLSFAYAAWITRWRFAPLLLWSIGLGALSLAAAVTFFNMALPFGISERYADAFKALGGAYSVGDVSSQMRILQAETAIKAIQEQPLVGSGVLSARWNFGYASQFGYFHPSDLGLLGYVYTFGILGLWFPLVIYTLWIKNSFTIRADLQIKQTSPTFFISLNVFMAYFMLGGAFTGLFLLRPESILFLLSIIYALNHHFILRIRPARIAGVLN